MKNEKTTMHYGRHVKGSVKAPMVVGLQVYKESINFGVGKSHLGESSNGVGNEFLANQLSSVDMEGISILRISQNTFLLAFENHKVKKAMKREFWVLLDQVESKRGGL
ncbi:hypothetical protein GOBAR_AA24448 [Gossypium barbadense]|uniref:Uncharacterized protein n=1 Tax=Gossypium barbadense TaxID=3634 RepID=A0A2P5WYV3_GOSBA|nr:hypothetical protein GOBAR_AA24448 [Gossypium barbadense]